MSSPKYILDIDTISRWIFFPIHIDTNGIIDVTNTFQFKSENNKCESVNCNRLLPDSLHTMGKAKADKDNRIKQPITPREYKGYIEANVKEIRDINGDGFQFNVTLVPEHDNPAHSHLQLSFTSSETRALKNLAKQKIQDCFSKLIES